MCLELGRDKPTIYFKKGWTKAYKFYKVYNSSVISPYQSNKCELDSFNKDGYKIRSSRSFVKMEASELKTQEVHRGIHVFLYKKDAINAMTEFVNKLWFSKDFYIDCQVIEVLCRKKDLVATGFWNFKLKQKRIPISVFTNVYIPKSEYSKLNWKCLVRQFFIDVKYRIFGEKK